MLQLTTQALVTGIGTLAIALQGFLPMAEAEVSVQEDLCGPQTIAVQGVGYCQSTLAVQGLVCLCEAEVAAPAGTYPLNPFFRKELSDPIRPLKWTLDTDTLQIESYLLQPKASSSVQLANDSLTAKTAEVQVRAAAFTPLSPAELELLSAKIEATGKTDLSDEELAAMLLELLNEN